MLMKILPLLLLATATASGLSDAEARKPRDEDAALSGVLAGQLKPLREIESMVVPRMGNARYIGPEIVDGDRYRLKFMRGSSVIWVDVDGRTGAILGRTGE